MIQKKKSYNIWSKKYEKRKIIDNFFSLYLNPLKSVWRILKENRKITEILSCETPKTSPRSMDLGPDLESEEIGEISMSSNTVRFDSSIIENDKNENENENENETVHTPSRCKVRKCLVCSRKNIPPSSPQGFLLQSSLDGSFLKSSIDGTLLKSTPQSVKITKNENPFIRFTPEFSARKKSIRDPFSLIGTYSAVDIVPVLTDGSVFRESKEIDFENNDISICGTNKRGDVIKYDLNDEINYEDASKIDSKYRNKKKSSNISFNFSPSTKNKNKITKKKDLNTPDRNENKNKIKVLRDETKDKNINRNIRKLDTFRDSIDSVNIGIPHLVFSPESVKIDIELSQNSEKDKSVTEMIRPKKQISRMEQNFIKRLGIVQKLDNDFVVRKYSLNFNSVDV